jgi:ATP/maltotriose-dependent transcriptional regulator MalT/DNA-binding SARP family transcriptional activator
MSVDRDDGPMTEIETGRDEMANAQGLSTHDAESITSTPASGEAHPSGLAIIASKICPAQPAKATLARGRLIDWFGQHADAQLLLVTAEAGYGKTTLLNDFALRTRDACVWYRLETSDGDWITFLSYLVAALRDVVPGFGRSTEALLRNVASMGSSREIVLAQFLAELNDVGGRRVAVILDDYHLVEQSPDVRMIMSRLLERAPEGLYFLLGSRGAPNLALGRLRVQGRVAELSTDDLRFRLDEIDDLFAVTYGLPLDAVSCRLIAERTDGWAASIQLVAASIAVGGPAQVAAFLDALSGARGPIYDFLAQEVLTRLSSHTQRILTRAALVDRIRPDYVNAALVASGVSLGPDAVAHALEETEALGLLGPRGQASNGHRMHPLFREFLRAQLEGEVSEGVITEMHRAIARAADENDWLLAAKHFADAGDTADAMRVLGTAASEALGTGAWGAAVEILDLMPTVPAPPAVKVIQARALVTEDRPEEARRILDSIDRGSLSAEERGLVGLTSAAIHHMNGEVDELTAEVSAVAADLEVPSLLHEVAVSWQLLLGAISGGRISDAVQALRQLGTDQERAGLHYFAGVTHHNCAYAELARGNYAEAVTQARAALSHWELADGDSGAAASTRSTEAAAIAESGQYEEALRIADASASGPDATADAIADAVYLNAICGRRGRATTLLARLDRGDARWSRELGVQAQHTFASVALALSEGRLGDARRGTERLRELGPQTLDGWPRAAVVAATLAVVDKSPDAPALVREAIETSTAQHAWRWLARARLLEAIVGRSPDRLRLWISESEADSALTVLELADAVVTAIGALTPLPNALERSILREPGRWIPALIRQVRQGRGEDASAAASLIARFGSAKDADVLRDYERARGGTAKKRGLAIQLVRRVSPTVRVHDLGLTSFDVGDRRVFLTETRRKPGALLLYLVTKRALAANREQVMDSLWPDQDPGTAVGSLHQTLFFLRRDIEPWYEDGATAGYVHLEGEVVRLDGDLFQIDSVAFARQAAEILSAGDAAEKGPRMLALYKGHFAPEFEYEEWAEEWRTHLHSTFLRLAHATADGLVRQKRFATASDVLGPVVALDPVAFDLGATYVTCLVRAGATDAAVAHYRSLASAYEREQGVPFRTFEAIVDSVER